MPVAILFKFKIQLLRAESLRDLLLLWLARELGAAILSPPDPKLVFKPTRKCSSRSLAKERRDVPIFREKSNYPPTEGRRSPARTRLHPSYSFFLSSTVVPLSLFAAVVLSRHGPSIPDWSYIRDATRHARFTRLCSSLSARRQFFFFFSEQRASFREWGNYRYINLCVPKLGYPIVWEKWHLALLHTVYREVYLSSGLKFYDLISEAKESAIDKYIVNPYTRALVCFDCFRGSLRFRSCVPAFPPLLSSKNATFGRSTPHFIVVPRKNPGARSRKSFLWPLPKAKALEIMR